MKRFCTGCRWWVHVESEDCTDYSFWYCAKYKTRSYNKRRILCDGRENEQ